MVAGHVIDTAAVASFAATADLVIAHNAGFDRKFCERFSEVFRTKAWACSQLEVNWTEEGFEGTNLGYLAAQGGFFYDRHRATNDCTALIEVLRRPLPSGSPALNSLLQSARLPLWRVWAVGAPFELKDTLKSRGYRWNGGEDGRPRAWHRDVPDDQLHAEKAFLASDIFRADTHIQTVKMTAFDRYSERC
jgi:DNA polymerase-3 subunit epsilon